MKNFIVYLVVLCSGCLVVPLDESASERCYQAKNIMCKKLCSCPPQTDDNSCMSVCKSSGMNCSRVIAIKGYLDTCIADYENTSCDKINLDTLSLPLPNTCQDMFEYIKLP